jgi:hypothetical protein
VGQVDADAVGDDGDEALMLMRLLRARSAVSRPGFTAAAAAAAARAILEDEDD